MQYSLQNKQDSFNKYFYMSILLYNYLRVAVRTSRPHEVAPLLVGTSYMT